MRIKPAPKLGMVLVMAKIPWSSPRKILFANSKPVAKKQITIETESPLETSTRFYNYSGTI